MNRLGAITIVIAALCAIALLGRLLPGCGPPASAIVGYVEGEYVAIAPIEVARIAGESVRRGDVLKSGDPVAPQAEPDENLKLLAINALMQQDQAQALEHRARRHQQARHNAATPGVVGEVGQEGAERGPEARRLQLVCAPRRRQPLPSAARLDDR